MPVSGASVGRRAVIVATTLCLSTAIGCGAEAPSTTDTSAANVQAAQASRIAARTKCVAREERPWTPPAMGAARFVVNRGTRGMSARVRWVLSPDSAAMLVVEDPVSIEADPVPDGVLYATERTGRTWRMDSVWSVAPSPDWRRLAVGRAVVISGGEAQEIPLAAWEAPARRLREIVGPLPAIQAESLRAHSYSASGMAVQQAAAVTFLVSPDSGNSAGVQFVALQGWRVGWTCDAASVLVGDKPRGSQDYDPAALTRQIATPPTPARDSVLSTAPRAELRWTDGPTLELGEPVVRPTGQRLVVRGRVIEGRDGRVVLRTLRADGGDSTERVIGPGMPLAATRGGHFILALAPRDPPRPNESADHAVVYRVP